MRDVAVIGFAQSASVRSDRERNEVEILMPVVAEAIAQSGIGRHEIGFTVSGSSDYLAGQPFSFVMALDAVGAWPPIEESHVEMDGADSAMLHVVDAGDEGSMRTGMRVRARWRDETRGEIQDIACFEPEDAR